MKERITSLRNPRVKNAVKLRSRRGREKQGRFVFDGASEIARALKAGVDFDEVFVCREHCADHVAHIVEDLSSCTAHVLDVSPEVFERLAFGDRAEGVVAVAHTPNRSLAQIDLSDDAIVAVLEAVEKPGNVGAVLRSADAAGVTAVIVADGGTDLYNHNSIRASLGAIFTVPVFAVEAGDAWRWLKQHRFSVFAARVDGATNYTDVPYGGRCALVVGNEATGLSDLWQGDDVTGICLPMQGTVDSLNVSTVAAVLFYEVLRQRS